MLLFLLLCLLLLCLSGALSIPNYPAERAVVLPLLFGLSRLGGNNAGARSGGRSLDD